MNAPPHGLRGTVQPDLPLGPADKVAGVQQRWATITTVDTRLPSQPHLRAPRSDRRRERVLALDVDVVDYDQAVEFILDPEPRDRGEYVCVANVHMVMEAYDAPEFAAIVGGAALVVPDGMPLVWWLRARGHRRATRVRGPTLVQHLAARAARDSIPIALYGGAPDALRDLDAELKRRFPGLEIAAAISPPFRPLDETERQGFEQTLRESGARLVLVGLGCPKQERWMGRNAVHIPAVSVGVGAAFDMISGRMLEAPAWMQRAGLEWLFRFMQEPRRLWRRYLILNARFALLTLGRAFASLLGARGS